MVTRLSPVLYLGVFTTLTFFLLSFRLPQQHMFLMKESSQPKPLSSSEASPNVTSSNSPERVQTILYYTPWWPDHASPKTWDLGEGSSPFAHCPQQSCYITANRSHLPSLAQFDALLFHSWNLFHKPGMTIPRVRSKNQRYILFSLEPASHCAYLTPWEEQVLSNFFNDTFTFRLLKFNFFLSCILPSRRDSSISCPYGRVSRLPSIETAASQSFEDVCTLFIILFIKCN